MNCPLCNKPMAVKKYEGVDVDICGECGGVWLDKGELGQIISTEDEAFTPSSINKAFQDIAADKQGRGRVMKEVVRDFVKIADTPDFMKRRGFIGMFVDAKEALEYIDKDHEPDIDVDKMLAAFHQRWGEQRVINCPKCSVPMDETDYAGTGIMIDKCSRDHGVWLDKGELEKSQIIMEYHKRMTASSSSGLPRGAKLADKACPHCKVKMYEKEYEAVPVDICNICGGVWLDEDELYQIIQRREEVLTDKEREAVNPAEMKQTDPCDFAGSINCPVCGTVMSRLVYACVSGIVIDRCPQHGVWLDKGELEKIQIYVEKSEDIGKAQRKKYKKIIEKARAEHQARRESSIKELKVSRVSSINKLMHWIASKLD